MKNLLKKSKFTKISKEDLRQCHGGKWVPLDGKMNCDADGTTGTMMYQTSWIKRQFGDDYKQVVDHV